MLSMIFNNGNVGEAAYLKSVRTNTFAVTKGEMIIVTVDWDGPARPLISDKANSSWVQCFTSDVLTQFGLRNSWHALAGSDEVDEYVEANFVTVPHEAVVYATSFNYVVDYIENKPEPMSNSELPTSLETIGHLF